MNTWIIILQYRVPINETKCSHRRSRRKVYGLGPPNTLKEPLWKLFEHHLTSRRYSPHRGKGFFFVVHPLQGKFVSYVLKLAMDIINIAEPLHNSYITTVLCLKSSTLTLCYQLLCCSFRQRVLVKEAVLRLSPKLWVFPAELQNTISPPTLTWPLALEI